MCKKHLSSSLVPLILGEDLYIPAMINTAELLRLKKISLQSESMKRDERKNEFKSITVPSRFLKLKYSDNECNALKNMLA